MPRILVIPDALVSPTEVFVHAGQHAWIGSQRDSGLIFGDRVAWAVAQVQSASQRHVDGWIMRPEASGILQMRNRLLGSIRGHQSRRDVYLSGRVVACDMQSVRPKIITAAPVSHLFPAESREQSQNRGGNLDAGWEAQPPQVR